MLIQLKDELISGLLDEKVLDRIENLVSFEERFEIMNHIQDWIYRYNINVNASIDQLENKLSELFGVNPNFRRTFEEKAAIWGFDFKKSEFAPYNQTVIASEEKGMGIKILVHEKFRKDMLLDLLKEIDKKLT
jgi:hypothetical protein